MVDTIYIEKDIAQHPQTAKILKRYPNAEHVLCDRYSEVFNPSAQNFRLQKANPALILARKHEHHVLPTPAGYGVGWDKNYYFSHMLNCAYDCRYCFLQGMYRSANYVVFVNYEDFFKSIVEMVSSSKDDQLWFFSGYDCDSLALEPVTGFMNPCLNLFEKLPQAWLEIRTKSTQIRSLLKRPSLNNVVVAFSFTPQAFSGKFEHGVPSVDKRIQAMRRLQKHGWKLGIRFDPMINYQDYKAHYSELFESIFSALDPHLIHSVSLGGFRLPKGFYKQIKQLYPQEPLFNLAMHEVDGMKSVGEERERAMFDYCSQELERWLGKDQLYYVDA